MHNHANVALLICFSCGCKGGDPELYDLRWTGREFIEEARTFQRSMERNLADDVIRENARRTSAALAAIPNSRLAQRAAFKADAEALHGMLTGCYAVGPPENASELNACRFEIGKLDLALEDMK